MTRYAALRQSHTPREVFKAAVEILLIEGHLSSSDLPLSEWPSPREPQDYRNAFAMASAFLRSQIRKPDVVTVLVDEVDLATFSALTSSTWSGLLAMLVLAFPEVQWVFMAIRDSNAGSGCSVTDGDWEWFWLNHGPRTISEPRGTPLFDGYGLRSWLREQIQGHLGDRCAPLDFHSHSVPSRSKVAVVLEDEPEFRSFEALMIYDHGFRVHSVGSWAEADRLLGHNGSLREFQGESAARAKGADQQISEQQRDNFLLSIEDLYIRFPDQTDQGMSDLEKREQVLPALCQDSPPCRRFVSVGHEALGNTEEYVRRKDYLRKRRDWESVVVGIRPRRGEQLVYKPAPGLYALWEELGLERVFRQGADDAVAPGLALDFAWPIQYARAGQQRRGSNETDMKRDHSAPGRLVEIAQSLLDRARAELSGVSTVCDAITGAVLATDALELLGGRTPTLSLEALSLKHMFEVRAAAQFVGVAYHLAISRRLADIRRNLKALSVWLHSSRKRVFVLNGEARILTRIVEILERFGPFEETVVCRTRLATVHRQIEMLNDLKHLAVGRILLWPVSFYADWALRSLGHYLVATVTGILVFVVGFATMGNGKPLDKALHATLRAMFTIELPPAQDGPHHMVLGYGAAAFGLLTFGLLVAYLYSKLIRR